MRVRSSGAVVISFALVGAGAAACGTGAQAAAPSTLAPRSTLVVSCRPDLPCPLTPKAFRAAYGLQPLLDQGIDGRGETVVLIERVASAGPPPTTTDINKDLATYDGRFGLPPAHLSFLTTLASPAAAALANPEE